MQTVLVIDDDGNLRDTIGLMLEKEGFRPVLAADGKSGFEQALALKPALILVDLRMPGLSGVEVCKQVGSDRMKLLYDIYHMQIMEGDVISTIRANKDLIGHYHTGGVPGRHELDDTQEINWRAVCRAIVDTGFSGYLAHEFTPTRDPLTSLREAVALCDV